LNTLSVENNQLIVNLRLTMNDLRFLTAIVNEGHFPLFADEDEMWEQAGGIVGQLQALGVLDQEGGLNQDALLFNVREVTQG
jgi:hypothetical protein